MLLLVEIVQFYVILKRLNIMIKNKPALKQPNILFYFVDNLGYGELGCYGGGVLRGADTCRIDNFAKQGLQLLNFAPESQCTPSRSALITGRYSIRSGTHSVDLGY